MFTFAEDGNTEEARKRAQLLLRYHKKAEELISSHDTRMTRSDEYDNFVLTNRDYLKTQLSLCEMAVQKILKYSNNYLYKVTASGDGRRVALNPTLGQQKLSVATSDIVRQHREECSDKRCVEGVDRLETETVQEWRDQAMAGQGARRKVIQEMVTRGLACTSFIQMVTGAGQSSIVRIRRQTK